MSVSFQVYRTCLEMAYDRGYIDAKPRLENFSLINTQEEFDTMMDSVEDDGWEFSAYTSDFPYRYSKSFSIAHTTERKRLFVIFGGGNKNATVLLSMIIQGYRQGSERFDMEIVYVHYKDFTHAARTEFATIGERINVQNFQDIDLIKNPGSHQQGALRYEKMTREESARLLSELRAKSNMLQRISANDPPVKYRGYQRGDIIRIVRTPTTEGSLCREFYAYRIVV